MMPTISGPSLRRLPRYMKMLARLAQEGHPYVTSAELARHLQLDETLVRKDLAAAGFTGKPRVGFAVASLLAHLEAYLDIRLAKDAFLIGAGRLGQALVSYRGFTKYGLRIVGLFDTAPGKIGQTVSELEIQPLWQAPALARQLHVRIAILAVPADAAQAVADTLADAGILAFWNFSGFPLTMPAPIIVYNEDLAESLAIISHQLSLLLATSAVDGAPTDSRPPIIRTE